jgi:CTP synthase
MKTKPTQQAIKLLREEGIFPDFIICRSRHGVDAIRKKKIEVYVHIPADHIISAPDVDTIYQIPLDLEREQLGEKVLKTLGLPMNKKADLSYWDSLVKKIKNPSSKISIAIVGKYIDHGDYNIADSYLSIKEALIHAGAALDVGVKITWLDAKEFEADSAAVHRLNAYDCIIVPGGFGASGVEGKMRVIEYARTHNIPYLGICYGMQLACVEFARNVCGMKDANTTEVDEKTPWPIIGILPAQKEILERLAYGGTMRLGVYPAIMRPGVIVDVYTKTGRLAEDQEKLQKLVGESGKSQYKNVPVVLERHRHRYEVNPQFVANLEAKGLVFSGYYEREDGQKLMEFIELPGHPYFVATQAHPEFKSRLGNPHPLFFGLIEAALTKK